MKRIVFFPLLFLANIIFSPCSGQGKIHVTYIANSGFLIESSGEQIIIDALFKTGWNNYLIPTEPIVSDIINQQDPFNISNLMLITHSHADHFNAAFVADYLIQNSKNILIAPPEVTNTILKHPDYKKFENQIVQLDKINQEKNDTTIKGIRIRSFFIQHDSRPEIENLQTWFTSITTGEIIITNPENAPFRFKFEFITPDTIEQTAIQDNKAVNKIILKRIEN